MASGAVLTAAGSDLDALFERLVAGLDVLPSSAALRACASYRSRLDAVEAKVLAAVVAADGGDDRRARNHQDSSQTSRPERNRRAKRAVAVAQNPALGEAMANGDLCGEQIDQLARASRRSEGAAVRDQQLIDRVGAAGPDQARKIIDDWLTDRTNAADAQTAHDRAHTLRRARRYDTVDGLAGIALEADPPSIDRIWKQLTADADHAYTTAGGRDRPASDHDRSLDQRLFDAAHTHLTERSDPVRPKPTSPDTGPRPRQRPTLVITATIDKILGLAPSQCAEQLGVGPIADSVLAQYLPYAEIFGLLFDSDGQPLRLGRSARHATRAQLIALFARDRCCVLCGADPQTCEAHHLIPWHAPARGPTAIENLALVCRRCHRLLHRRQQTLFRDHDDGIWKLRPAQPHELPPPLPPQRE